MACNEYLQLLSGHIDGANSEIEERRLQQHLRSCRRCRELLQQLERVDAVLLEEKAEPPADLTARIMEQVRKEPKKEKIPKRRYFPVAAAGVAAAALLCFVFLGDLKLPEFGRADASPLETVYIPIDSELAPSELPLDSKEPAETVKDQEEEAPSSVQKDNIKESEAPSSSNKASEGQEITTDSQVILVDPGDHTSLNAPTYGAFYYQSAPYSNDEFAQVTLPELDAESPERDPVTTEQSPILIIWGADADELTALKGVQKSTQKIKGSSAETVPTQTLYQRLLSILPMGGKLSGDSLREPRLAVEEYSVSYNTLKKLFEESIGEYELNVYYPESITDLDNCTVYVVSISN